MVSDLIVCASDLLYAAECGYTQIVSYGVKGDLAKRICDRLSWDADGMLVVERRITPWGFLKSVTLPVRLFDSAGGKSPR